MFQIASRLCTQSIPQSSLNAIRNLYTVCLYIGVMLLNWQLANRGMQCMP